jgi:hypothetical protein
MAQRLFGVAGAFCAAFCVLSAMPTPFIALALAQSSEKPPDKSAAGKEAKKIDEFVEAQQALNGPAGNPECVWLGRRAVNLLWRDDLDTAFRHLDLYDRFGCPSAHIQAAFRCLIQHGNHIDPKAADTLNARVSACWLNPLDPAIPPPSLPPAAAASSSAASH